MESGTKIVGVVAIGFDNGTVGRMQLVEQLETIDYIPTPIEWTDDKIQAEIDKNAQTWAALGLKAQDWARLTAEGFPNGDSDFRDAWAFDGKAVTVDLERAKDVTRNRLRAQREPVLQAADISVTKALEKGDMAGVQSIGVEKQRLRDITKLPQIDAAKSLDDLRSITLSTQVGG